MYKRAEACFWTAEDFDFSNDVDEWNRFMSTEESNVIVDLLIAALTTTIPVVTDLMRTLSAEVQSAEARSFYGFVRAMSVTTI